MIIQSVSSCICSSYQNFHNEIVRIKEILVKNSFPRALIDRIIKSFLDKRFAPRPPAPQEAKTALLFCMPYLGRYSLQIKTKINRIIKQCYPGIQLNVIFRSPKRIQSFFPFKDRFPTLIRSSVVYKFQCPGCHASYFGKTSRNLITRCREHLGINKAGQKIKASHRGPYQPIRPVPSRCNTSRGGFSDRCGLLSSTIPNNSVCAMRRVTKLDFTNFSLTFSGLSF